MVVIKCVENENKIEFLFFDVGGIMIKVKIIVNYQVYSGYFYVMMFCVRDDYFMVYEEIWFFIGVG